jgi:cleavage and polyadenylation specificity factor subunit 1
MSLMCCPDFNLEQIIPAADELTGVELEIIGSSFYDPYVSLIRDDSSITVWQSTNDELVELERADGITSAQWMSASVYKPPHSDNALLFALAADGALKVRVIERVVGTELTKQTDLRAS